MSILTPVARRIERRAEAAGCVDVISIDLAQKDAGFLATSDAGGAGVSGTGNDVCAPATCSDVLELDPDDAGDDELVDQTCSTTISNGELLLAFCKDSLAATNASCSTDVPDGDLLIAACDGKY